MYKPTDTDKIIKYSQKSLTFPVTLTNQCRMLQFTADAYRYRYELTGDSNMRIKAAEYMSKALLLSFQRLLKIVFVISQP